LVVNFKSFPDKPRMTLVKLVGSWFARLPGTCKHHLEKVRLEIHHQVPSNSTSVTVSGLTFFLSVRFKCLQETSGTSLIQMVCKHGTQNESEESWEVGHKNRFNGGTVSLQASFWWELSCWKIWKKFPMAPKQFTRSLKFRTRYTYSSWGIISPNNSTCFQ
jgi:hypothetical protein